jgi:hypothetical protein
MPKKDKATLEFTAIEKQFRMPFVIYADFECLLTPVDASLEHDADKSYTDAYNTHDPCGFCVHVVAATDVELECTKQPIVLHTIVLPPPLDDVGGSAAPSLHLCTIVNPCCSS